MRSYEIVPDQKSPTYEEWLGTNGPDAGNGVTECRFCGTELTDEEYDDNENLDVDDKKVCYSCMGLYFEWHPLLVFEGSK
jgi:hypothetical protein